MKEGGRGSEERERAEEQHYLISLCLTLASLPARFNHHIRLHISTAMPAGHTPDPLHLTARPRPHTHTHTHTHTRARGRARTPHIHTHVYASTTYILTHTNTWITLTHTCIDALTYTLSRSLLTNTHTHTHTHTHSHQHQGHAVFFKNTDTSLHRKLSIGWAQLELDQ